MRWFFIFLFAFLAACGNSAETESPKIILRSRKSGETKTVDKAKYLALPPDAKAVFEVVFTATIGGLEDETFFALEGRSPKPGEDLGRCQFLPGPEKTFKYYQRQFHRIAASQVRAKATSNPSEGLVSFWDDYIPCTSGRGCRYPIGSFAVRLKVVGGKVVDKLVEERDYGWCDFDKNCLTTEQIDQEYRCRNFGNPPLHLFNATSKLENVTIINMDKIILRSRKSGETRTVDKAKYLALPPDRQAAYEIVGEPTAEQYAEAERLAGKGEEDFILLKTILPDGEHTIWFQIGTDNFLKNNSVVEAEVE